jgi:NitT/TauT family transport system ATP-binding protein
MTPDRDSGMTAHDPTRRYVVGNQPMMIVDGISFAYEAHSAMVHASPILTNISFSIPAGQITSIIGESGSGKTTLLNLIAGILQPQSGTITVPKGLSYLPQDDLLLPFRTAWQNICLAAELRGILSDTLLGDARSLLGAMKLSGATDSLPQQLSGGMRRRVALARQLLPPADTYLLDEPLGEQDRGMRETLEEMLFQRFRAAKSSALIVTHDLDSAVALSDAILVLDAQRNAHQVWECPPTMLMPPADRRRHPIFALAVSDVWREMWKALGNE